MHIHVFTHLRMVWCEVDLGINSGVNGCNPMPGLVCCAPIHVFWIPMCQWLWVTPDNDVCPSCCDSLLLARWDPKCCSFLMQYSKNVQLFATLINPSFSSLAPCLPVEAAFNIKDGFDSRFKSLLVKIMPVIFWTTYFYISPCRVLGFGNMRGRCQWRVLVLDQGLQPSRDRLSLSADTEALYVSYLFPGSLSLIYTTSAEFYSNTKNGHKHKMTDW